MEENSETHTVVWRDIEIEVTFRPKRWGVTDHLEIRSINPVDSPLPMTSTGYRSHFLGVWELDDCDGDAVAYVTAWLEDAAKSPVWLAEAEAARQGELF